ncbi:MAG: DNA-protecting protein DprA [Clostridia bacterium]|nr:DNA-protecting protein DprA [Clostridia bacterium]
MEYWIWLSRIEGLGPIKIKELLKQYKTPENIWELDKKKLMQTKGIGENIANSILKKEYRENLEQYVKYMKKYNIGIITIEDKDYPKKLLHIYDAPAILYYKGDKKLLHTDIIAMIGCRECSNYGKEVSIKFSYELAKKGITIISGMAKGIDSYSHIGCIKAGGKTIAVLGSGLDIIYPKENCLLYDEILSAKGLILSEYVIGTKPSKLNFPARNRIISGLSNGVIVVEAKGKSGTLNTVDFALEQGKDIFVVPGNITSTNSTGTNELIKQGASCVTGVEDILK